MAMLAGQAGVPDFVLLEKVEEESFMKNLKLRFQHEQIYTYIGNVVVAVNPYKKLDLYSNETVECYRGRNMYENTPHIFALTDAAHRAMRRNQKDQTIVISGESGAGKTECSKIVMRYIAAVSGNSGEVDRVKNQLLQSNPILEAFGNAKTNRNDNSSRFGKYMDIHFDYKGDPCGGHIDNYLLEKSRVVHQGVGERNFHIFYQIMEGADDALLEQLQISRDASAYKYTNQSGCVKVKTINDKGDFLDVQKGMKIIGFSEEESTTLFKIVSAILHVGNLTFSGDVSGDLSTCISGGDLQIIAKLLSTSPDALKKALTYRVVAARGEVMETPMSAEQAAITRETLSKALYDRAFSWLVKKINTTVAVKNTDDDRNVIGVLDIYGFEIFESNSFEQFCINYCNEKLQQLFISLVLQQEQEEYHREGIEWKDIDYFNNKVICDLVDAKTSGIIALLDEECLRPGESSNKTLLAQLNQKLGSHAHYESRETNRTDKAIDFDDFKLKHYAGDVVYKTDEFLDKNRDTLFQDLKRLCYQSESQILKEMFEDGAQDITAVTKRPITAGTAFKGSMNELVDHLLSKEPHYIRCIKPNETKSSSAFNDERCTHQVRYLGLLENVRVRRAGFADRQTYERFLDRYKMLSDETWPFWNGPPCEGVKKILGKLGTSDDEVRYGNTKLFIRSPKQVFFFEEARESAIPSLVITIQKAFRGLLARRYVEKLRAANLIKRKLKFFKARNYINSLFSVFEGVSQDPALGIDREWPSAPPMLLSFLEKLKAIHLQWRARRIVGRLTPQEQAAMRLKIIGYDLFKGRRSEWALNLDWTGDYLLTDPHSEKYSSSVNSLLSSNGDNGVVFSERVLKVNRNGKAQQRAIAYSEKSFYKMDPKLFKLKKIAIPLSSVNGVSVSEKNTGVVVVHAKDGDTLMAVANESRAPEFVARLFNVCRLHHDKSITVNVSNNIAYSQQGKEKCLTFCNDPNVVVPTFKKEGSNMVYVTRE